MSNVEKSRDFERLYDKTLKRNYWVLGYFGDGHINVVKAFEAAEDFSIKADVPIETVYISEITNSRRFKGFKYISSTKPLQEPENFSVEMDDVFFYFTN